MTAKKEAAVYTRPVTTLRSLPVNKRELRRLLDPLCRDQQQEMFFALPMDKNSCIIGGEGNWLVHKGTVDSVEVYVRDVFRFAVERCAVAVVVAHNHPSGNVTPSKEDEALMRRLRTAGRILGIHVASSAILGPNSEFSFTKYVEP